MMKLYREEMEETDSDLSRVRVVSEDATGQEREYLISLTTDRLDDGYLMGGRRVDDDAPDEPGGGGPSQRAWDIARRFFREREGFEVHE